MPPARAGARVGADGQRAVPIRGREGHGRIRSAQAADRMSEAEPKKRTKGRELLLSLGLLAFTLIFGLALCELSLRLMGRPFKNEPPSELAIARFDPELGWSYVPDKASEQEFGQEKRKIGLFFDRFGSRVEAAGMERDPNMPTLLIVGCSYMMGHG